MFLVSSGAKASNNIHVWTLRVQNCWNIRERGTRTEYEIPGRMEDGGWKRPMVSFFFFLYFFSREMSNGARATRDPPATHPWMINFPGGAAAPPDPPGLRLRAMMPMADALKIYSRDLCIYAYAPLIATENPPGNLTKKAGQKRCFAKISGSKNPIGPSPRLIIPGRRDASTVGYEFSVAKFFESKPRSCFFGSPARARFLGSFLCR